MDKKLESRIDRLEKMVKEGFRDRWPVEDIDPAETASTIADNLANAAYYASVLIKELKFSDDKSLFNEWVNTLSDIKKVRDKARRLAGSMA